MVEKTKVKSADTLMKNQILNQIPTPVMAVNRDLEIIYLNQAGQEYLEKTEEDVIGQACRDCLRTEDCTDGSCCMRKAIDEEKPFSRRTETKIKGHTDYIEYYAVPLFDGDEVVGGLEFILNINDRVTYERKLQEQAHTIQQMSTPTIKLWEGVLLLPIVGVIDSMRSQYIMESMLTKIAETYSRVIILDIHGVAAVDTAVANHLIKITKATKLMGCECIISGISPAVAQTVIQLGIDMHAINTKSNLSDAVDEAFKVLGMKVIKVEG